MNEEYNAKLCDERHEDIGRKFELLFKKFDILSLLVAFFTLLATALGIIQAMAK
jgi:hypothetical protein